jgi:DNA-binding transcriptional LysR family regulator
MQNNPELAGLPLVDLDVLKTLVAIAETGNFSAAAEAVYRTPSAISMQVKKLEEMLGKPVFIRDSRSVRLTEDGEFLLRHARRLLAMNREMMARFITPEVAGVVRLGAPDDAAERFLPDTLRRFAETHPCITVDVIVDSSARRRQRIANREFDLALGTCSGEAEGCSPAEEAEIVYEEQLVWAAVRGGIAAEKRPLPISVWEETCIWRNAGLDALKRGNIDYRIAFQSAHISGQKAAILADLAVSPIPISVVGGDIVAISPDRIPMPSGYAIGLITAANMTEPAKAAADHLRASFAMRNANMKRISASAA